MKISKLNSNILNDAEYSVIISEYSIVDGQRKQKIVWRCPFYTSWRNMLKRAYSLAYHELQPTYIDCSVCDEWLTFSNFRSWMEQQDWEGKELDKDILKADNRVYSPLTCCFIDRQTNSFILERQNHRGKWPLGVGWIKRNKKFRARVMNPFTKKEDHLGLFDCPDEAHKAWLKRKLELAYEVAALQKDPRVAKALIERYENYE